MILSEAKIEESSSYPPASDDPEDHIQGYDAQFSTTRLAPKQALRIANPDQ